MAATLPSSSNGTYTTGDLVLTKPTGLAVGDLMVVAIIQLNADSVTTPSGWSNFVNKSSSGGSVQLRFYSKTADSSDVAASNFTFVDDGDASPKTGSILRIAGFNTATPSSVFNGDGTQASTATPSFASTVTPDSPDSIVLFAIGTYGGDTSHTFSSYAVVTSNPSWTEIMDLYYPNSTSSLGFGLAWASRPQITATGNSSCTISISSRTQIVNEMIVIRSQIASSTTETTSVLDTFIKTFNKVILDTVSAVDTLTAIKGRFWGTLTKNVSSWINTDKS